MGFAINKLFFKHSLRFLIFSVFICGECKSQEINHCTTKQTCRKCIEEGPRCAWCSQENYTELNIPRCNLFEKLDGNCSDLVNPKNFRNITKDDPLSNKKTGDTEGDAIQIKPQDIWIKIRPNTPETFTVSYRQAKDYPVDLYFLMDLSHSMEDDKDKLALLGNKFAEEMQTITTNFRLGFGSFVDKVAAPYVAVHPNMLRQPCKDCAPPYGFRNHMPLSSKTEEFAKKVRDAKVSGNLDSPEGTMDAIMQAVVCKEKIGWREKSRKLLVVSTDNDYHYAGDGKVFSELPKQNPLEVASCAVTGTGAEISARRRTGDCLYRSSSAFTGMLNKVSNRIKHIRYHKEAVDEEVLQNLFELAGIIEPNDGECHLDDKGYYSKGNQQDYPSLSQINRKIKENNVNLIFAVTSDQVDRYNELKTRLVGSTTGKLEADSSNIVQLVRKQYEEISSSVKMTEDTAQGSGNIEISYHSSCLDGEMKKRNECKNLKVLDTVTFNVTVNYTFCPEYSNQWNQQIRIYPVGLNESLTVHLEMICECDCEKPGNEEINSTKCSLGNGTYECGVCNCYNNKYGKECECDGSENPSSADDRECHRGNDEQPCSNRGECRCGKCYCNVREYYGKYCECNNFSCDQVDQKICNGHGLCDCGSCKCFKDWSGSDCSCMESTKDCIDDNGKLCGEKGQCVCGSCKCEDTYYGQFCDDCPSCAAKCAEYRDCVECSLASQDQESTTGSDCEACQPFTVEIVDQVEVNETQMEKPCSFKDDQKCNVFFKYTVDENNLPVIYMQRTKECPLPPNMLAIVGGTTGGIVIAGVILLIMWKILTDIHDKRELEKFEKERKNATWESGENPIYVGATSTFQNPSYRGH